MDGRGDALGLGGCCTGIGSKSVAKFKQAHAPCLTGEVALQRRDQAWQQAGTHHSEFGAERVGQRHGMLGSAPLFQQASIHEGVVHRFQIVTRGEMTTRAGFLDLRFTGCGDAGCTARQGRRNAVIAVDTRQFFDQVFLDGDVEAATGRNHIPSRRIGFDLHAECAQHALHVDIVDFDAKHACDAAAT